MRLTEATQLINSLLNKSKFRVRFQYASLRNKQDGAFIWDYFPDVDEPAFETFDTASAWAEAFAKVDPELYYEVHVVDAKTLQASEGKK
jgi:hypothetical protein